MDSTDIHKESGIFKVNSDAIKFDNSSASEPLPQGSYLAYQQSKMKDGTEMDYVFLITKDNPEAQLIARGEHGKYPNIKEKMERLQEVNGVALVSHTHNPRLGVDTPLSSILENSHEELFQSNRLPQSQLDAIEDAFKYQTASFKEEQKHTSSSVGIKNFDINEKNELKGKPEREPLAPLEKINNQVKSFNIPKDIGIEKYMKPIPKKKKEFNGPNMS